MGISVAVKYNWRKEINKSDCYQIDIRVTINSIPQYYKVEVPQKVPSRDWSGIAPTWVKNSNPFSFAINDSILKRLQQIADLQTRLYVQGKKLTFFHLNKELNFKGNRKSFNDYFKNYVTKPPEEVVLEPGTWEKYRSFIGHLDNFNPNLRFDEIDVEMAARIRNFLTRQPGSKPGTKLAPSSIKSLFDKFMVVLQHAATIDKLIDRDVVESIIKKVTIVVPDRQDGLHWDVVEIQNLKKIPASALLPSQIRDRKLFLLQIYGSWYYRDLFYMSRWDVHKDHEFGMYVAGARSKNDQPRLVPLWKFPGAEAIMKEFEDPDPKSTFWFRRDIFVESQAYNRNLKVLADMAGVYRDVTNKTARHTGMTLMARLGVAYPALKKIAGQKIRDIGRAYIKMGIREIIDATELAQFDRLGI
ncbi:site-specific integrase [Chitinophaga defluvii]|uniref:Site-specific integrase n=1 Tax=Chitinophaga defluvii TaxID=3163343 RepID=A0ABV2T8K8_9BACT